MGSWFTEEIVDRGRLPMLVCLLAFVVTFVTTRVITRMIREGRGPFHDNVTVNGTHVHHVVPGMLLLIAGSFVAIAADVDDAWSLVAAALIGVGTSLVLDEFALILHLRDVYWAEEGRISIEVVALTIAVLGLAIIGLNPTGLDPDDPDVGLVSGLLGVLLHIGLLLVVVVKGKYRLALFGAFIPLISIIGAVRLARPGSMWARRRYRGRTLERAERRAAAHDARWGRYTAWASDFLAGRPTGSSRPALQEAAAESPGR